MTADTVHVVPAKPADRAVIEPLLQLCVRELSIYRDDASGEGSPYPYLDLYWREPDRKPFLIRTGQQVAGFALVNAWAPSGLPVDRAMAEFYVAPDRRRAGIGARAALDIIGTLPGSWEVGILAAQDSARAFWTRVVRQVPGAVPKWLEGDGERWSGPILRFGTISRVG